MWPWIRHWRDWARTDLWPLSRPGVQGQAMHHSYEKGGLVIDDQPIPWNADAVVVECLARLPGSSVRRREDFLLRIPGRYLFAVTSVMIAFLAAGMAAQAVLFLAQADVLTAFDIVMWDTSWLLSDGSVFGKALHTLIGYNDRPTGMQLLVYLATLLVMFLLMRMFAPEPKPLPAH